MTVQCMHEVTRDRTRHVHAFDDADGNYWSFRVVEGIAVSFCLWAAEGPNPGLPDDDEFAAVLG